MEPGEITGRGPNRKVSIERSSANGALQRRASILTAFLLLLLGAAGFFVTPGLAKEKKPQTRTVSGVVFDNAENPIEGAMVELKDLQTSKVLDIYSQEGGQYQFADLSFSHDYTIKATYKGSSSEVRQISSIESRARLVLNLTIPQPSK